MMGAMAPSPHWLPEDDFLLKNAVEAGASLESLAKGAIQFSKRYTVQELQDRWLSLLYDPVVSIEASDHMIVVERSGFTNQSRPNKLEGVKELGCSSGKKRKADSVRSVRRSYYAMRKRISNDPFDLMGINLLSGPSNSNFGDGHELSSAIPNDLGIPDKEFDIRDPFFSEFGPQADESVGNVVQNHGQGLHQSLPCPYVENISLSGDDSEVRGFDQSKELPLCNLFEAEGLQNDGNACPEFGGPAFLDYGCSSSLPQMPIWSASPETSAAGMPIQIGERDQQIGDAFVIPQAGNGNEALKFDDVAPSSSNLETGLSSDNMIGVAPPAEDYLAELSNTLFDFTTEDELLFLFPDGNNTIDKSYFEGLSSLLLDSPNQNELPSVCVGEEAEVVADGLLAAPSVAHPVESDSGGPHLCDQKKVPDAQVAFSLTTAKDLGPEYRCGVICCTLNTEDPEVPDNDDVFLPFRFPSPTNSSGAHWRLEKSSCLVSSSSKSLKTNGGPSKITNNQRDSYQPSRMMGSSQSSDVGLKYPIGDRGVKFELPKSNIQHAVLRNPRTDHISSANASANTFFGGGVKVGAMEMEGVKNLDCGPNVDKNDQPFILQNHQNNASGSRNELDVKAEFLDNGLPDVDLSSQTAIVPQSNGKSSTSDEEEWSEKDFDVPYFSDVEAMILDMDLRPEEFDITANREVQRLQLEETKRTIIRLEQSAHACTQRAIAAQDAFAVLYGRHSKHFIKKPEVLLGRSTDESKVDIDFGREKNGGKISRRQAIMKLDMNGMFRLKNLGRSLIHVNGEEVAPGHALSLRSGCLIEVKGLCFVFETNDRSIKEFVDNVDKSIFLDPIKLESETE